MNILLISGHGATDVGASGNGTNELTQNRRVTARLKEILEPHVNVDIYPTDRNAYQDSLDGRIWHYVPPNKYDYVLEVHFNAFNKKTGGTEIFVTPQEKFTSVEKNIVERLGKYFKNRGVKRENFRVINMIQKNRHVSTALLEICFIDYKADMDKYFKNFENICEDIANGIMDGFGVERVKNHGFISQFKFSEETKVRNLPDLKKENESGMTYKKNEIVNLDRNLQGETYVWGSYISLKEQVRRYVILGNKKTGHWNGTKTK